MADDLTNKVPPTRPTIETVLERINALDARGHAFTREQRGGAGDHCRHVKENALQAGRGVQDLRQQVAVTAGNVGNGLQSREVIRADNGRGCLTGACMSNSVEIFMASKTGLGHYRPAVAPTIAAVA